MLSDFGQFSTDLSLFTSFKVPANIVIGFRLGGGITGATTSSSRRNTGSGTENLRGYRKFRFAGDKMVYNNIDVRIPWLISKDIFFLVLSVWFCSMT